MKYFRKLLTAAVATIPLCLALSSCHSIEDWDNDYYGNFDALWTIMDEHYCFFEQKGVNWDSIGNEYRARINEDMEYTEFFDLCADMLDELKDGHTNLISWFNVSYYRKWWSDYPQNFDWRLIQENYLHFDYHTAGGMSYKLLGDGKAAYCYYSTFSAAASDAFINEMMMSVKDSNGLILDLRDNGGGELTNVERIVSHFINERTLAGYISHKTGKGHNDFSEPYPYSYDPVEYGVRWLKPVIVLTNRSTYSAANNCVQVLRMLPHVIVIGDTTGGGSGTPMSSQIPCGWSLRFSASPIYDAKMQLTENGIEPDYHFDTTTDDYVNGRDRILDVAIAALVAVSDDENNTTPLMTQINDYIASQVEQ